MSLSIPFATSTMCLRPQRKVVGGVGGFVFSPSVWVQRSDWSLALVLVKGEGSQTVRGPGNVRGFPLVFSGESVIPASFNASCHLWRIGQGYKVRCWNKFQQNSTLWMLHQMVDWFGVANVSSYNEFFMWNKNKCCNKHFCCIICNSFTWS